jgi:hypothetical protein
MTCSNAKFQVLSVLGLATCLGLYPTVAMAEPQLETMESADLEEYCDKEGGIFVEGGNGSFGCAFPNGSTFDCMPSGDDCTYVAPSLQTGGVKMPGAPKPLIDADLSPDAETTKGGLEPKLQTAPLSPQ